MKLLLFLIGISLCSAFPTLGSFEPIDVTQAQNSVQMQQFINAGLQAIIQDGTSKNQFNDTSFQLSTINSIYQQVLDGQSYQFNCDFKNQQNDVIKASFEVRYDSVTSTTEVMAFNYTVQTVSVAQSVQATYVQVDAQEVQSSSEIQSVLNYGVAESVKKSIADKTISDGNYNLSSVTTVEKQAVDTALFYKCDVNLQEEHGTVVVATFTVYYQPFTNAMALIDYLCVTKTEITTVTSTTASTPTSISTITSGSSPSIVEEGTLFQVDSSSVQEDDLTNTIFQYGVNQILQKGIRSGKIPNTQFTLVEISEFSQQTRSGRTTYSFTCEVQNTQNINVQMTFKVTYQILTERVTLTSWSYHVTDTSDASISQVISPTDDQYIPIPEDQVNTDSTTQSVLNYGVTQLVKVGNNKGKIPGSGYQVSEISEAYSQIIGNWIFFKFVCIIQNPQTVIVSAIFTVSYQIQTSHMQLTQYSYDVKRGTSIVDTQDNTLAPSIKPVEGQYVPCTQQEINTDQIIQDALTYGTQQIYLRGLQSQKIQQSSFQITTINSVSKQIIRSRGTFYQCDVVLKTSIGATITTSFTVLYQSTIRQYSISQWSYHVSTIETVKPGQTELGTYTSISISTVQTSTIIQGCINFGIDQVLQIAVRKGKITSINFELYQIISVTRRRVSAGAYYKCKVQLSDTFGSTIITTFNVYYESRSKRRRLRSYTYDVNTMTEAIQPIAPAYTTISQQEISVSIEIQSCMSYGVSQIIQNSQEYSVSKINSVQRQIVSSTTYYKFDIELASTSIQTRISFTFTVSFKYITGERYVFAYSYFTKYSISIDSRISYKFTKINVLQIQSNSRYQNALQSGVKSCLQNLYDKQVIASQDFSISEVISFSMQITTLERYRCRAHLTHVIGISLQIYFEVQVRSGRYSLTSFSVEGYTAINVAQALTIDSSVYNNYSWLLGSYDRLPISSYDSDSEVKACVDYGVRETVKIVVKRESYSRTDFRLQEIKSVSRDTVSQSVYRVESILVNSRGATIECNFLVKSEGVFGRKSLSSYAYTAY